MKKRLKKKKSRERAKVLEGKKGDDGYFFFLLYYIVHVQYMYIQCNHRQVYIPHNLAYKAIILWGGRSDRGTFEPSLSYRQDSLIMTMHIL